MKKFALTLCLLLTGAQGFAAEEAAKELFAQRQAIAELNVNRTDVTIHEKNMGNGVRCYYVVESLRSTASQSADKANPGISCVKVD